MIITTNCNIKALLKKHSNILVALKTCCISSIHFISLISVINNRESFLKAFMSDSMFLMAILIMLSCE